MYSYTDALIKKFAAELTRQGRKHVATKNFAIARKAKTPKSKAKPGNYPIHDLAHARNALARVSAFGTPEEKKQVRQKVYSKYPGLRKRKQNRGGK